MNVQTILTLSHEEINKMIPYQLICETVYGARWESGSCKRKYKQKFTEKERRAAKRLFKISYDWSLVHGAPEKVRMSNKTYLLWQKLAEFCSEL